MRKLVFWLTLSFVFAAAFPAAGQQDEAARVEKMRELASAQIGPSRYGTFKTSEEWRRNFERDVRYAAARLFSLRGSEPNGRKYKPEEYDFGGAGRLSPAQIETLRLFSEPFLELPRRPLTEREIDATTVAFSVSRDDVALRAAALDAFVRYKYGDNLTPSSCRILGVDVTDDIANASYDELQASLAALLENHSSLELLDEIQKRPRYDQTILLDCLLERVADRLDDYGYAVALSDLADLLQIAVDKERPQRKEQERGEDAYELLDDRLAKAAEARPKSWEVAYVVASTLWRLPTTFKPSDVPGEPPKRVRYDRGVKPPESTLYSHKRDRALAIRTLARALSNASAADPSAKKTVERPNVLSEPRYNVDVDLGSYFYLFHEALLYDKPGRFITDLDQKTNLDELPPFDSKPLGDPSHAEEKNKIVVKPFGSAPLVDYFHALLPDRAPKTTSPDRDPTPISFKDAENDRERLKLVRSLNNAEREEASSRPKKSARRQPQNADPPRAVPRRALLVGDETVVDSITQHYGFTNELRSFMAKENLDVEFVPLGIRHTTYADWRKLVSESYSENAPTDVDGVSIKDEFDKGADVVVLFLGFNDARQHSFKGLTYDDLRPRADESRLEIGASLREDIAGLVADLRARIPQCRIVLASVWPEIGGVPKLTSYVAEQQTLAAQESGCDVVSLGNLASFASKVAKFAAEEIDVANDDFSFNCYASQLMTWATLLALDPNQPFDAALKRARSAYWNRSAAPQEPSLAFDKWEKTASRYFESSVDRRLYDGSIPGFTLSARLGEGGMGGMISKQYDNEEDRQNDVLSGVYSIPIVVHCRTREIEPDQPLPRNPADYRRPKWSMDIMGRTSRPLYMTPKFDVVSCGNLKFEGNGVAEETAENGQTFGNYNLIFSGTIADLPCDITIAIGDVQKTTHLSLPKGYNVSGVFPLGQKFSSLEDFPQEKTITRVDFAALAGEETSSIYDDREWRIGASRASYNEPLSKLLREEPSPETSWASSSDESRSLTSDSVDSRQKTDGNWIDVVAYRPPEPYAGVYLVRYFNSPKDQSGTLKLGVKGYKTHVVERVYLNGEQVFFGELNVDDPEKQEAAVQVQLKKGPNVMIARVDHTEWDWIVGFTLLDEKGRELEDSLNRW